MDPESRIQIVDDGDGLVILGAREAVGRFLRSTGLWDKAVSIADAGSASTLRLVAGAMEAGAEAMAEASRWVKLTPESAAVAKQFGFMETSTPGVYHAMIGEPGAIGQWVQIEAGTLTDLANPAYLAGIAGVMSQIAMQQEIGEIKEYLARIDGKVDELIRGQRDAQLSKVMGAGDDIETALAVLERQGRVDDDTWSIVQGRQETISDAIRWVELQLKAVADQTDPNRIRELKRDALKAQDRVAELLAIAARCFELQGALDLIRLDRAADSSLDELNTRRLALAEDRERRRDRMLQAIEDLMARLYAMGIAANSRTILHRPSAHSVITSVNDAGKTVDDFRAPLGLEPSHVPMPLTRLVDAVRDPAQLHDAAKEAGRVVAPPVAVAAVIVTRGRRR